MQIYPAQPVSHLGTESRVAFIKKTYLNLMSAIAAFTLLEIALFTTGIAERIFGLIMHTGSIGLLVVFGGFALLGNLFHRKAYTVESRSSQYIALYAYVVIEALIFVPILMWAKMIAGPELIQSAAAITLAGFAGLTGLVFFTKKDFSFMGSLLKFASIMAIIVIVGGFIFGYQLGLFFSCAMIALAGGFVLYETSNVLHHCPEDRYVGAALGLFAAVALMFYWVLRLLISLSGRD